MTVKELIELLSAAPQGMDVFVAYDSLVCTYVLTERKTFYVAESDDNYAAGIYLCAMSEDEIEWHLEEVPVSDEKNRPDPPIKGRRIR